MDQDRSIPASELKDASGKKAYTPPVLRKHGRIDQITKGHAGSISPDLAVASV